jgi:hypothetical protein
VSFPWTGIWRAYPLPSASDPIVGKGLRSLIGRTWSWRSSLLFCASDGLVGAISAFGETAVGEFCLHRPAPVLLGGIVSRPLAQPALRVEPVFSCWSRGDSWDASRHIAWPVVRPISHPHDKFSLVWKSKIYNQATAMLVHCFLIIDVAFRELYFWCCLEGVSVAATRN